MNFPFIFRTQAAETECGVNEIFPFSLKLADFVRADILDTYTKILTDAVECVHGLPDEFQPLLWDNCLQSEAAKGLVSLIAEAMTNQADLFLVFAREVNVIRKATSTEEQKIKADYQREGASPIGIFVSFRNYRRTEMLRVYSNLEYFVLSSLHKTLGLAKSVQVKAKDLRASNSLSDSAIAIGQARSIAEALRNGQDVLLDAEDTIETAAPDLSPTEKAIQFLYSKRAFILGLPLAYVTGEQTGGLGTSGENDQRAVERGLKQYYSAILSPVLKALFGLDRLQFKSQDFRSITTALEALKTFDLVTDNYLSAEDKRDIAARLFALETNAD